MKVVRFLILVGLTTVVVRAQFRFPQLPTPPRILFGGFRPLFSRPRTRPRPPPPPPPVLFQGNQFFQQQNQIEPVSQFIDSPTFNARPLFPPPNNDIFLAPSGNRLVPPPVAQFAPSRPDLNVVQNNALPIGPPQLAPLQRPIDANGFGSPRPDSIIDASQFSSRPQIIQPQGPPSFSSPQRFGPPTQSSFPPPLISPNSNNIIGMTPPPPPSPTPPALRPPPPQQRPLPPLQPPPPPPVTIPQQITTPKSVPLTQQPTLRPLVPVTARPNRPVNVLSSNALDDLLVNPVPSVNAGVLPLANEKPSETQLFPPFV